MSALHAFQPEDRPGDSAGTFRCDRATIRQVLDWWEQNPARETISSVAEAERRRIWGLLRDEMGDCLVLERRPFHLLAFINKQARVKKKNTRRRWNTTIQQPFNEAERLGLIIKNPFRGVSFPKGDEGRDWTEGELAKVLEEANQPFGELVIGLRLSGLRPHEGCDLTWRQIRFDLGNIRIDKHKTRHVTHAPRIVPLNEPLIQLFSVIRQRGHSTGAVFLNTKKRPWTRQHADSTFRRLREQVGLPSDLKLHGCRHSFITGAILNDVGVAYLMQIAGHSDIRTTQRYVHLTDKTDHLNAPMNQAVKGLNIVKAKEYTPLFDGLE